MYRFTITILIFLCSIISLFGQVNNDERKKVGLVLSGGAAKGFAHIGVLKVLEEAGIPIDYIAGTSMGAIVGGLYAVGYSAEQLDSLCRVQDWSYVMSDNTFRSNLPGSRKYKSTNYILSLPYDIGWKEKKVTISLPAGAIEGQNINNLFLNLTVGYHKKMDFNNLIIPFSCVAADARTGKEIVLNNGILAEALRASMAIPGMFSPVEMDSMLLIDGGIINNYPVDVVRKMGADIIIGVTFPSDSADIEKNKGTMLEVMGELSNFTVAHLKQKQNIENTDILITPYLQPYGLMDFQIPAIDSIINRGEKAARLKLDELIALKDSLKISSSDTLNEQPKKINPYINQDTLIIDQIHFEGLERVKEKDLLRRIKIKDKATRNNIETMVSRLYGSGLFTQVYYKLEGESPFDLVFVVEEEKSKMLNIGARFDTHDMASILVNTSLRPNLSTNVVFDITGRLNKNPYLIVDYSINRGVFFKGGVSYKTSKNHLDIFNKGLLSTNLGFRRHNLVLNFSEFYFRNIKLHLGTDFDFINYFSSLTDRESPNLELKDEFYINYFINGVYDTLDKSYFPTTGSYMSFRYSVLTDNFIQMNNQAPLNVFNATLTKPIQLTDKLYATPRISGRVILNAIDDIPAIYKNFAGGLYDGHYLPQQLAIRGTRGMEIMKNSVVVTQLNLRYEFKKQQFLHTNFNFTLHHDNFLRLLKGNVLFGSSIGYTYNTIVGPITVESGLSAFSGEGQTILSFGYNF